jgi:large subunit ribosomal protein L17
LHAATASATNIYLLDLTFGTIVMRHRRKGRVLGRSPAHRKALFSNLVAAIFLTERETSELDANAPKVRGRIVTTLEKAKEVRPLVEKCITIARKGLLAEANADEFATKAERGTEEWKAWRKSDNWKKWADARSPGVAARRRVFSITRDKKAVELLFSTIAPRFMDRPGGYTRIMRLAKPRLGDNGTRAILEFVGKNDRVTKKATKPSFETAEAAS